MNQSNGEVVSGEDRAAMAICQTAVRGCVRARLLCECVRVCLLVSGVCGVRRPRVRRVDSCADDDAYGNVVIVLCRPVPPARASGSAPMVHVYGLSLLLLSKGTSGML